MKETKTQDTNSGTHIEAAMGNLILKAPPSVSPTQKQTAQRAYERWQQGGRQPGMAELDWSRAEQELTGHARTEPTAGASTKEMRSHEAS